MHSLAALLEALRSDLDAHARWAGVALQPLSDKGLAHHHVRLAGTGLLARIPKQSQLGLQPGASLAHQQACFERAAASGHAPRLHGVLPVSLRLPRGALLVEEIEGHAAVLPRDLPAMAKALAAIHCVPLPPPQGRWPLAAPADPLQALVDEIEGQARHLRDAQLQPEVAAWLEQEVAALRGLLRRRDRPPLHLIAFDAHPGNFVMRPDGAAVLVDLEKCRYGPAGLDLAHATLYTSTTWDVETRATLDVRELGDFYATWSSAVGGRIAAAVWPWHVPLRRAMWLWSLTWCCKWKALSRLPPRAPEAGEDWSTAHSEPALVRHVRDRVDHYLSAPAIARVQHELRWLEEAFAR